MTHVNVDLVLMLVTCAAVLLAFARSTSFRRRTPDNPEHRAETEAAWAETAAWLDEVEQKTGRRLTATTLRLAPFEAALEVFTAEFGPPKDVTRFPGVGRAAALWQWGWGGFVLRANRRMTVHLRSGDAHRELAVDDLAVALGEVRTWRAANETARAA